MSRIFSEVSTTGGVVKKIERSKHIHTYQRMRKRPGYFRCTHPDCTHYVSRDLLLGKRARCYLCGESMILNWQTLRLANPHCDCKGKVKELGIVVLKDSALETKIRTFLTNPTFSQETKDETQST